MDILHNLQPRLFQAGQPFDARWAGELHQAVIRPAAGGVGPSFGQRWPALTGVKGDFTQSEHGEVGVKLVRDSRALHLRQIRRGQFQPHKRAVIYHGDWLQTL